VGFGTYDIGAEDFREALRAALEAGYTHIDTAEGYMNESEIGEVIAEYDREKLFLTSKVLPKNLNYESVLASCEASLDRLGTDYLDLYLIHWPNPAISLRETFDALAKLRAEGKVRNVGVSNFSIYQLDVAHHVADVRIAVSTSPEHIAENIDLFGWELSEEDHERIDDIDREEPAYDTRVRDWDDDVWGISR